MELFKHELRKIIETPLLWGFIAICIVFNILSFLSDIIYPAYDAYVEKIAHKTGYVLNDEFYAALDKVSASELTVSELIASETSTSDWYEDEKKYLELERAQNLEKFIMETASPSDVFDNYDITRVADEYISTNGITKEWIADALHAKYKKTQPYVEQKAESNESLTLYMAGETVYKFRDFFGQLMPTILMEGIILASLIALFSMGYEYMNSAEQVVYCTKKGRNVLISKLGVSLLCGLGSYVIIALITLMVYFIVHDYSGIWNSSISSIFNMISDEIGSRPFTTYGSLTIWQYLSAVIGISLLIVIFFTIFSFVLGIIQRNTYVAFGIMIVLNAAIAVAFLFVLSANNIFRYILALTPISLWIKENLWFTDGGSNYLCTHFETVGTCFSLAVIIMIGIVMFRIFKRRNIA